MDLKINKIKIISTDGHCFVYGKVAKNLGVHFNNACIPCCWRVTHLNTGRSVASFKYENQALAFVALVDWLPEWNFFNKMPRRGLPSYPPIVENFAREITKIEALAEQFE